MQEPPYEMPRLHRAQCGSKHERFAIRRVDLRTAGVWSNEYTAYLGVVNDCVIVPTRTERRGLSGYWKGDHTARAGVVQQEELAEYHLQNLNADFAIPLGKMTISDGTLLILGFFLP
jgi:hypothetical protein